MTTTICNPASGSLSRINWNRMLHVFMSLLVLFAATTFLTACGKKGAKDMKKGVSAMEKGDYESALEAFEAGAEKENPDAQMSLAVCYAAGIGVKNPNFEKAEKQLAKAAKAEDPVAQAAYGLLLFVQAEDAHDEEAMEKAVKYLKKSAEQDCAFGQLAMAVKSVGERKGEDAVKYLKKVADKKLKHEKIFLDDMRSSLVKYALNKATEDLKDDLKEGEDEIVEAIAEFLQFDKFTVTDMCILASQAALYAAYSIGIDDLDIKADKEEAEKWLNTLKKNGLPKTFVAALKVGVIFGKKEMKEREERAKAYSRDIDDYESKYDDDYDY